MRRPGNPASVGGIGGPCGSERVGNQRERTAAGHRARAEVDGKVRAAALMKTFGAELAGNQRTLSRTRPGRVPRRGGETRAPGRRAPAGPADRVPVQGARRGHEREAGGPAPTGRGGGCPGAALRAGPGAGERLGAVPGARRSLSRRGRGGDGMTTEALVPAAAEPAVATRAPRPRRGFWSSSREGSRMLRRAPASQSSARSPRQPKSPQSGRRREVRRRARMHLVGCQRVRALMI